MRPSIPPATVTSSPVTWPESSSEGEHDDVARDVVGSTPTWIADFAAAWHTSTVPVPRAPRVIGEYVHPGATAFTLARGAMRTISFFGDHDALAREAGLHRAHSNLPRCAST